MYIKSKETLDKVTRLHKYTLVCRKCNFSIVVEASEKEELSLASMKCGNCDKVNEEAAKVAAEAAKDTEKRHTAKSAPVEKEVAAKKKSTKKRSR